MIIVSVILLSLILICLVLMLIRLCKLGKTIQDREADLSSEKANIFPSLFSLIALVCSCIALAVCLPRSNVQYSMDYWDVIIAILALLITILLGWQIYNTIKFEEQVRKVEKAASEAEGLWSSTKTSTEELDTKIKSMQDDISAAFDDIVELKEKSKSAIYFVPDGPDDDK